MRYLTLLFVLIVTPVMGQNIVASGQSSHYGIGASVSNGFVHSEVSLQAGIDVRINSKAYISPLKIEGNLTEWFHINPFVYGSYSRNLERNFYGYGIGLNIPFKKRIDINLFVDSNYNPEISFQIRMGG